MRHPFFNGTRPLLFAHRGGSGVAPENTVAAFDQAMTLGVDGIELDVHLSRDGIAVVHHDATLTRTTGRREPVAALTADELGRLDAAASFVQAADVAPGIAPGRRGGRFAPADTGVPRLADVLRRYRDTRVIIELKVNDGRLASAVVADVRAAGADERVCLGSSALGVLRAIRRQAPHLATSAAREEVRWALYRNWVRWPVRGPRYGGYQVPEMAGMTRVVSRRFIDLAHGADLAVQVWTVDRIDEAARLLSWGVDGLISDRPDRLAPLFTPPG